MAIGLLRKRGKLQQSRGRFMIFQLGGLSLFLLISLREYTLLFLGALDKVYGSGEQHVRVSSLVSDEDDEGATTRGNEIIFWNNATRPAAYHCAPNEGNGYGEMKAMVANVLPEYEWIKLTTDVIAANRSSNEYDIFLNPFPGRRNQPSEFHKRCGEQVAEWLLHNETYRGKFLWFTGESPKSHPLEIITKSGSPRPDDGRDHYFGVITDDQTSRRDDKDFLLTYLQMVWFHRFAEKALRPNAMTDPFLRPKGDIDSRPANFMIYANGNCVNFREEAVGLISQIGQVHCDGRCQGKTSGDRSNLTKTSHRIGVGNWWNNVELYSKYRFCFVMEHEKNHSSYITEKILMAFAAGCVPIYYGPELIFDIFNRNAFVFYNISNPQESLDQIRALENDQILYKKMMDQPIVAHGNETLQKYFSFGDDRYFGKMVTCKEKMRKKLGVNGLTPIL